MAVAYLHMRMVYIYTRSHKRKCIYIRAYTYIYTYTRTHAYIHAKACVHIHIYIHTYTCTYIRTYIHTHIYIYIYIYIYWHASMPIYIMPIYMQTMSYSQFADAHQSLNTLYGLQPTHVQKTSRRLSASRHFLNQRRFATDRIYKRMFEYSYKLDIGFCL